MHKEIITFGDIELKNINIDVDIDNILISIKGCFRKRCFEVSKMMIKKIRLFCIVLPKMSE